jgi:hypothetical protein
MHGNKKAISPVGMVQLPLATENEFAVTSGEHRGVGLAPPARQSNCVLQGAAGSRMPRGYGRHPPHGRRLIAMADARTIIPAGSRLWLEDAV